MARVAVIGLWHLGSVVAAALARLGHQVRATDPSGETVAGLARGEPPVYEPGLAELVRQQLAAGRLSFHAAAADTLGGADAAFVTFDTPVDEDDQSDLAPIEHAFDTLAAQARGPLTVVLMSQVPVGTCRRLDAALRQRAPQLAFALLYQPENLRLGQALETFLHPDRVVIGSGSEGDAARLETIYAAIPGPRLGMSWESAEMAKHALNSFLATSISFANEIAELAEAAGADMRDMVASLRSDRRVGPHAFLAPGPGFAGGTLGRDVQALLRLGAAAGRPTLQLAATWAVNAARLPRAIHKLQQLCGGLEGRRIALLGLTYKPGTNTLRRSHAVALAHLLTAAGAEVRAFDPQVRAAPGIAVAASAQEAVHGADAVVLATAWPEFERLDWAALAPAMRQAVLLDLHNALDDAALRRAGFRYAGTGRPEVEVTGVAAGGGR